ncbi:unnamed protein product [Boreogadus saida]
MPQVLPSHIQLDHQGQLTRTAPGLARRAPPPAEPTSPVELQHRLTLSSNDTLGRPATPAHAGPSPSPPLPPPPPPPMDSGCDSGNASERSVQGEERGRVLKRGVSATRRGSEEEKGEALEATPEGRRRHKQPGKEEKGGARGGQSLLPSYKLRHLPLLTSKIPLSSSSTATLTPAGPAVYPSMASTPPSPTRTPQPRPRALRQPLAPHHADHSAASGAKVRAAPPLAGSLHLPQQKNQGPIP